VSQYGAGQSESGEVFVPATPEAFGYDTDGNLTSDGRWTYFWDGENRLVEMKRDTSSPTLSSRLRLTFEYDHQGRRIRKTYYTHNGSGWVESTDTVFLYDGWNLMGELDANASNAKVRTYVWGIDMSGTIQGAGGVGGLLKVTDYTSGTTHHFVAYDGNGNVAALVDAGTGAITARYEYGPFGEPIRATGTMAKKHPLRFSTKYTDNESGFLYYGYRYYNPSTGRWLNRDPIEEFGGRALYAFVGNNPISFLDALGLADTLEPGGNANGSIPANGPGRNFTPDQRGAINQFGQDDGCHSCGSKTAGTKTGNFVPDHQPPSALAKPGQQQRLYPHCLPCSQKQGGEVSAALRAQRANAARAREVVRHSSYSER
jgi:RHS repeat-associated protein